MNMRLKLLLLIILLSGCANQNSKENHAEVVKSPEQHYAHTTSRDPDSYQSPINILSSDAKKRLLEAHEFDIKFQDKIIAVENVGHTIQLDFKEGSTVQSENRTYNIKQMHFHTPSEHLVDGVTYPMELHIVSASEENSATPRYLVVGILFKMGKESTFINDFLPLIPKDKHKISVEEGRIKLANLLSRSDLDNHYHYKGSLTTPPYTETVNWFVLKKIFEASPEQIEAINAIEGNNARHIESKNGRVVKEN